MILICGGFKQGNKGYYFQIIFTNKRSHVKEKQGLFERELEWAQFLKNTCRTRYMRMAKINILMRIEMCKEILMFVVYHHLHKRQNSSRASCLLISQKSKYSFTREDSRGNTYIYYVGFRPSNFTTQSKKLCCSF